VTDNIRYKNIGSKNTVYTDLSKEGTQRYLHKIHISLFVFQMEMHIFCQDIYTLIRIIMKDGIISTVYHTLELLSFPYSLHTYCIRLLPPPDPVSLLLLPRPSQSRQSAKLFLQSSDLGLPHPFSRRRVCLPTL
jgi:hypothetical protein